MIVAQLERALLTRYPKADAEGWDHVAYPWATLPPRLPTWPARSTRPKPT